jgi:hypothetical protein
VAGIAGKREVMANKLKTHLQLPTNGITLGGINPRGTGRDAARFHIHMILGTNFVTLEDRKYLPVHRYQTLELVEFITEESIDRVFSQVSASLYTLEVVAQLEIKPEDMVSGITYPRGTTITEQKEFSA